MVRQTLQNSMAVILQTTQAIQWQTSVIRYLCSKNTQKWKKGYTAEDQTFCHSQVGVQTCIWGYSFHVQSGILQYYYHKDNRNIGFVQSKYSESNTGKFCDIENLFDKSCITVCKGAGVLGRNRVSITVPLCLLKAWHFINYHHYNAAY